MNKATRCFMVNGEVFEDSFQAYQIEPNRYLEISYQTRHIIEPSFEQLNQALDNAF